MLLLALLVVSAAGETTRSYDLQVAGSDPIRIIEQEPQWQTTKNKRAFNSGDPLHQFLTKYQETIKKNKLGDGDYGLENVQLITKHDIPDKSKSWGVSNYPRLGHPYDDQKGWVSLEPVPWSVSKVAKWQSSKNSQKPMDDYEDTQRRPSWSNYNDYYDQRPDPQPIFARPTAVYDQKVKVNYRDRYHEHSDNCKHNRPPYHDTGSDIITDGHPPNFPQQFESNRRQGTEMHTHNHPFTGDGDWILLSTTKGYKYPQRPRALQIKPDAMGAHRTVKLTVLPPEENSKINMTTSHGGLLQVESTFQTVEQAHSQHTKKQKRKKQKVKPARQAAAPTVTTTRRNAGPDSSAVLAAVGAGMIPATMAMLVPMAMGGRRKRSLHAPLQVTLPHNL